jgi:hypothetical protein
MWKKMVAASIAVIGMHLSVQAQLYISTIQGGWSQYVREVQLNDVSINIKPHGSYLEITEDAVIGTAGVTAGGKFGIDGTFLLPEKATLTSFYLSKDTGMYAARLQPLGMVDSGADTTRGALIASITSDGPRELWINNWPYDMTYKTIYPYRLKIDSIALGKEYRMVLKYLVPNTGNSNARYGLGVVLHSASQHPGVFELSYTADSTAPGAVLNINNMNFQLTNNQSIQVQYQQSFSVTVRAASPSTMHLTQFADNSWKGHYLLLNTSVPDTVLQQLGIPIEVAVLWRWNQPGSFVDDYGSSDYLENKALNYGYQAISQALAIKELCSWITSTGNRFGMVHSVQTRKPEVFPLCRKNSAALTRIESYLDQFTETYFKSNPFFSHKVSEDLPGVSDSAAIRDTSGKEFVSSLRLTHALYSNDQGIMRHLIIMSSGPARMSRNLITLEEVDSLLRDVTIDCANATWTDVPFTVVSSKAKGDSLIDYGSFRVPEFMPHSLLLNVSSQSKTYTFPLSPLQASFSIVAKSEGSWSQLLTWKGFDRFGRSMNTATSTATVFNADKDTGLAKLWAADNARLNDKRETGIDSTYGIVSQLYGLKIYPSYLTYGKELASYAAIDLTHTEKVSVRNGNKVTAAENSKQYRCTWSPNGLRIALPAGETARRICIFSLSGKLLLELDVSMYRSAGGYLFPAKLLTAGLGAQRMVIIRIEGTKQVWSRQVIVR